MNEILKIEEMECYEENGTVYLKLETVARGLGFTKTDVKFSETDFRKEYVRIDWPRVNKYLEETGFDRKWSKDSFIPENIFYRLAMKAKNETAEAFQKKVADEIIPSIRKRGNYTVGGENMSREEFLARAVLMSNSLIEEQRERIGALQPKADYFDEIINSDTLTTMTNIAKDYGKSAIWLNNYLELKKIQYKQGKDWILYAEYAEKGYAATVKRIVCNPSGNKYVASYLCWTEKGRHFIYGLLKEDGILPITEREKTYTEKEHDISDYELVKERINEYAV